MGIKLVIRRDKRDFENEINDLLSNGFKIEFAYNTNDDRNAAIMSNGVITEGLNAQEIDSAYKKESEELKKDVKLLSKEKSILQDSLADAQNKYADAVSEGEKLTGENRDIIDRGAAKLAEANSIIIGKDSEIGDLKKELATCKGQNTKLQNKINKLIED